MERTRLPVLLLVALLAGCGSAQGPVPPMAASVEPAGAIAEPPAPASTSAPVAASAGAPVAPSASLQAGRSVGSAGWHLARSIPVPGRGALIAAGGALWVEDNEDREFSNGLPKGVLYRIDPSSGATIARIPHFLGGLPTVGDGAIWYVSAEGLQDAARVDLATNAVARFRTSTGKDPTPEGIAITPGAVWVANHFEGRVVKVDPRTLKVVASVVVSDADHGVHAGSATDGTSVWFGVPVGGVLVRIDAATASVVSRFTMPRSTRTDLPDGADPSRLSAPESMAYLDGRLYVSTTDHIYVLDVRTVGAERVVADIPVDQFSPAYLTLHDGAVWALGPDPITVLRIDPGTLRIDARLDLGIRQDPLGAGPTMAVVDDGAWIRLKDRIVFVATR